MYTFISIGLLFLSSIAYSEEAGSRKINCSDIQGLLQKDYFATGTEKYRNREDAHLVQSMIQYSLEIDDDFCGLEREIHLFLDALLKPQESALFTEGEHGQIQKLSLRFAEQLLETQPAPNLGRLLRSLAILSELTKRYELGSDLMRRQDRLMSQLKNEAPRGADFQTELERGKAEHFALKIRKLLKEVQVSRKNWIPR